MALKSLIVKIGADYQAVDKALADVGRKATGAADALKKVGNTPLGKQAQQDAEALAKSLEKFNDSQRKVADSAKAAAAGIQAIGGPARLTKTELDAMNRSLQSGLDAFRAMGQQAPRELQKVAAEVQKQQKAISSSGGLLGKGRDIFGALGIGVGTLSTAGIVGSLAAGAKAALAYADSLTKLSDRTGITTTGLQRLANVANASGNTVEQVATGVNRFQKLIAEGSEGTATELGRIGLSITQLRGLNPDDQFFAIAKGIQSIKDPAEQTRVAMELFGKAGAELLPTLKSDVDALNDATVTMSAESVAALDAFGDGVGRLKNSAVAVLGELAASALQIVGSLADFPEVMERARASAARRPQGAPAPDVSIPGMLADFGPSGLNIPPDAVARMSREQLLALVRGEAAFVRPPTSTLPQIEGAPARGFPEPANLSRFLKDDTFALERLIAANKAAEQAIKPFRDAMVELTSASGNYVDIVNTIDGSMVQAIRFYLEAGVSQNALAAAYGLTATQIKAVATQRDAEVKGLKESSDLQRKQQQLQQELLGKSGTQVLANLKVQNEAYKAHWDLVQREAIDGTASQIAQVDRWVIEEKAKLDTRAINYQAASDAIEEAATARIGEIKRKAEFEDVQIRLTFVGPELSPEQIRKNTGIGGRIAGDVGGLFSGGDITRTIISSLTGGGGLSGGLQAVGSSIGAKFTSNIGESITKNMKGKAGELIGGLIGPLGALVGPMIAGLSRLISGAPEWQKFQKDVGRDLGVNISDGLAQALEADSERFGRQAATLLNLDKIIAEGGGVEAFGIEKAIAKTRDLFSMLETGQLSAQQVGSTFNRLFSQIIPEAIGKSGLATREFIELQELAIRTGINAPAVDQFRREQVTGGVLGGLSQTLQPNADASSKQRELQKQLDAVLARSQGGDRSQEDAKAILELTKQIAEQQRIVTATTIESQGAAQGFAAAIVASFGELQRGGLTITEALAAVQPNAVALQEQLTRAGLDGGAAFAQLQGFIALASDEMAGPALNAVGGIGQALAGLSNTGLLTQDMFSGLTGQVSQTFEKIVGEGKNGEDALRLMQPTLQTIYELQQKFGFSVDEATQALLDQATAAGIVGEAQKTPQQQQIDAAKETNQILLAIADVLGAKLPAAARVGADGVNRELDKIKDPEVKINVDTSGIPDRFLNPDDYDVFGRSVDGGSTGALVHASGLQHLAGGGRVLPFLKKGTDTVPAMLTPGEVVLNAAQQERLSNAVGGSTTFDLRGAQIYDGPSFRRYIASTFNEAMLHDDAGIRRVVSRVKGAA